MWPNTAPGGVKGYLEELEQLNCSVPADQILLLIDSQCLLKLLRTKLTLLQKRASHSVAKIIIMLHHLQLDPYSSLGYAEQREISTWYPDLYSKASFTACDKTATETLRHDLA